MRPRPMSHRHPSTEAAAVLCLVLAGLLSGCATVSAQLGDSVTQSISAVQTARLALATDQHGASTFGITATAITDSLKELSSAGQSATRLDVSSGSDAKSRQSTLALIRETTDAVNAARQALGGHGSLHDARQRLDAAAKKLQAQSKRLGEAG